MPKAYKVLMMNPIDLVAVALEDLPAGLIIHIENSDFSKDIQLKDPINFGHKFAVCPIKKGQDILKYGEIIGMASQEIEEGAHVHVHNLEGKRGRGDKIGTN